MSFLKSIKGTLKSVQGDISDGLKTLAVSPEHLKAPKVVEKSRSKVNWDAGAEILHRNELLWKDLYQVSEDTAQKAQEVDAKISEVYEQLSKRSEVLMRLHAEAAKLPMLLEQLQHITDSLALVEDECGKVEAGLVQLENVVEDQEYQHNVSSHHKQLAVYKMKKEHELQTYKVHLAKQHAENIEKMDRKRQHLLQEKHEAYQDQFNQDVDYFKKHGKPGRV